MSHQVKALEQRVGVALFERVPRGVRLTGRGASLFAGVHGALLDIAQTLDALRPAPDTGALTVSTTHSFAALWLVPRLGRFHQAYPQYQLRLDAQRAARGSAAGRQRGRGHPLQPEALSGADRGLLAARVLRRVRRAGAGGEAGRGRAPAEKRPRWSRCAGAIRGMTRAGGNGAGGRPAALAQAAAIHAYEEEHYALQAAIAGQGLVLASSVMVSDSVRLGALAPLRPGSGCRARPIPRCARGARAASAGARLPGLAGARIRGLSRAPARGYHVGHCLRAARYPGRARSRRTRTVNRFQEMTVFLAVAEAQSFAAAAPADVGALGHAQRGRAGRRLGVLLLLRTTRSLRLTEAGQRYADDCRRILEEVEQADDAAAGAMAAPRGALSLTAPALFGELHVMPVVMDYLRAHPQVSLRTLLVDRVVNLLDEGRGRGGAHRRLAGFDADGGAG